MAALNERMAALHARIDAGRDKAETMLEQFVVRSEALAAPSIIIDQGGAGSLPESLVALARQVGSSVTGVSHVTSDAPTLHNVSEIASLATGKADMRAEAVEQAGAPHGGAKMADKQLTVAG